MNFPSHLPHPGGVFCVLSQGKHFLQEVNIAEHLLVMKCVGRSSRLWGRKHFLIIAGPASFFLPFTRHYVKLILLGCVS